MTTQPVRLQGPRRPTQWTMVEGVDWYRDDEGAEWFRVEGDDCGYGDEEAPVWPPCLACGRPVAWPDGEPYWWAPTPSFFLHDAPRCVTLISPISGGRADAGGMPMRGSSARWN